MRPVDVTVYPTHHLHIVALGGPLDALQDAVRAAILDAGDAAQPNRSVTLYVDDEDLGDDPVAATATLLGLLREVQAAVNAGGVRSIPFVDVQRNARPTVGVPCAEADSVVEDPVRRAIRRGVLTVVGALLASEQPVAATTLSVAGYCVVETSPAANVSLLGLPAWLDARFDAAFNGELEPRDAFRPIREAVRRWHEAHAAAEGDADRLQAVVELHARLGPGRFAAADERARQTVDAATANRIPPRFTGALADLHQLRRTTHRMGRRVLDELSERFETFDDAPLSESIFEIGSESDAETFLSAVSPVLWETIAELSADTRSCRDGRAMLSRAWSALLPLAVAAYTVPFGPGVPARHNGAELVNGVLNDALVDLSLALGSDLFVEPVPVTLPFWPFDAVHARAEPETSGEGASASQLAAVVTAIRRLLDEIGRDPTPRPEAIGLLDGAARMLAGLAPDPRFQADALQLAPIHAAVGARIAASTGVPMATALAAARAGTLGELPGLLEALAARRRRSRLPALGVVVAALVLVVALVAGLIWWW